MSTKTLLRSAVLSISVLLGAAGMSQAQVAGCEITELSASRSASTLYIEAETEILVNENVSAGRAILNRMAQEELNCFEEGIMLNLSAQAYIVAGDYSSAAGEILTKLNKGYTPESERANTYKQVGQIYFQVPDYNNGLNYWNRWVSAGGRPTRDEKFAFAQINNSVENFPEALRWLEQVYAQDGDGASDQVLRFLLFLYDKVGDKAKKAQILEQMLVRSPEDRQIWDAIASDYRLADDERAAFEVQKAMYLGGILESENELLNVVKYYNQFDVPYQGALILEKEINAGRISGSLENLKLLADLWQLAREPERAVPIVERAAREYNSANMYERLGRAYSDLREWEEAEAALRQAISIGRGLENRALAWVYIGQSLYERGERSEAREAFRSANSAGGRGWIAFMNSEDETAIALERFKRQQVVTELESEQSTCKSLEVLNPDQLPEGCETVAERLEEAKAAVRAI